MKSPVRRPAETATALGAALAVVLAKPLGLDEPEEAAALAVILGTIPAAVTFLVDRFGSRPA